MKLVFATHNQNKLKEIKQLIPSTIILKSLNDLNYQNEIEETGDTLKENALIKTQTIYNKFQINTFADDTGLEIEALNGEPGVRSARYAGEENDATKNMEKVLHKMKGISNRKAKFKTIIALIINNEELFFEGIIHGTILHKPIGTNGFGYDPIFLPDGYDISFAQMDSKLKNEISHRGLAIKKLTNYLSQI